MHHRVHGLGHAHGHGRAQALDVLKVHERTRVGRLVHGSSGTRRNDCLVPCRLHFCCLHLCELHTPCLERRVHQTVARWPDELGRLRWSPGSAVDRWPPQVSLVCVAAHAHARRDPPVAHVVTISAACLGEQLGMQAVMVHGARN